MLNARFQRPPNSVIKTSKIVIQCFKKKKMEKFMMTSIKILKGARIGVAGGPRGPHCGCRGSLADMQLKGQSTPSSTRASPESGRSRQRQNHPEPRETEPLGTDRDRTTQSRQRDRTTRSRQRQNHPEPRETEPPGTKRDRTTWSGQRQNNPEPRETEPPGADRDRTTRNRQRDRITQSRQRDRTTRS